MIICLKLVKNYPDHGGYCSHRGVWNIGKTVDTQSITHAVIVRKGIDRISRVIEVHEIDPNGWKLYQNLTNDQQILFQRDHPVVDRWIFEAIPTESIELRRFIGRDARILFPNAGVKRFIAGFYELGYYLPR